MKYILLIMSFVVTCIGALLLDLTTLKTLGMSLIVWGLTVDFGIFLFWHREEDW